MAEYEVWVSSAAGQRLALVEPWIALRYRRVVNDVGTLGLAIPLGSMSPAYFAIDNRLEVWRNGKLVTETTWLVRYLAKRVLANGERVLEVGAVSASELLARRIVAYTAGSAQAQKSGHIDDMMKAIVRENLGDQAGSGVGRDISAYLSIEVNHGAGPSLSKAFAYRNVLDVLQELAAVADEAGTPVFFDIVAPEPSGLQFRTYIGQRGTDHAFATSTNPIQVASEAGTLDEVERSFDYSDEVNWVLAAGQGLGADRAIATAGDNARILLSPLNRREAFRDARHIVEAVGLLDAEAQERLRMGQPRRVFRGRVRDMPGLAFGREWGWGDRVSAMFEGEILTCRVDVVEVLVDEDGAEHVTAEVVGVEQ